MCVCVCVLCIGNGTDGQGNQLGLIVGASVGGCAFLGMVSLFFIRRYRRAPVRRAPVDSVAVARDSADSAHHRHEPARDGIEPFVDAKTRRSCDTAQMGYEFSSMEGNLSIELNSETRDHEIPGQCVQDDEVQDEESGESMLTKPVY
jgi:hypothetical protein